MPSTARRFEGSVAMITGAGGGIGSAIAERLAAEGAHAIVCDVAEKAAQTSADRIVAAGGAATVRAFDLRNPAACTAAVAGVAADHGRIDVLVNNAGVNRRGDLLSLTDQDWDVTS